MNQINVHSIIAYKKISILGFKLGMMRYLLLLIIPVFGLAQKGNVFSNTADKAKIELAKQKMYSGQYLSAINSLKEIAKSSPNDPNVHHYIGASYFALNRNEDAKEYLNKAISLNPDKGASHFILGRIYQSEEEYDK
ncbi:MAG: tetratricopeptide repeat protein, partial [Flavobacteriales bacterium]|nr:tetratricopeptide repeat protein [Flavobacteriales bacterium]